MASSLFKTLIRSSNFRSTTRNLCLVRSEIGNHTAKWMQDTSKKSPMELINEVHLSRLRARLLLAKETAIRHLVTQLSSYALTLMSQQSANIVAYAIFKSTTTRSLKLIIL